jgi:DNA-binding response OmpR family regulator
MAIPQERTDLRVAVDPQPLVLLAVGDVALSATLEAALRRDGHAVEHLTAASAGAGFAQAGASVIIASTDSPGFREFPGISTFERASESSDPPLIVIARSSAEAAREAPAAAAVFVPPLEVDDLRTVVLLLMTQAGPWGSTGVRPAAE